MTVAQVRNYSTSTGEFWNISPLYIAGLDVCNLTVTYTHPRWNDTIHVETWLLLSGWYGRFQASSGGGWITGFTQGPAIQVSQRYAVSTTNGDYAADSGPDEWALSADGSVNLHLQGFASLALHELTVIGKLITGDISR